MFKSLVNRALRLCSTWNLVHTEIQNVRSMLLRNCFPSWILDRIIKSLLNSFVNPRVQFGPVRERWYLGLPYLGKQTELVRRKIIQICKRFVPHKDVIVYFKKGRCISDLFRLKDVTPFELRSRVVYQYTCPSCHASYIGQTGRHLRHRIAEHMGVSHLTSKEVKNKVHSNIREHGLLCSGSNCARQNFSILASGNNEQELLVKERLLISRHKPTLNGNTGSFDLLLY